MKKLRISQQDFLLANRRASRQEEIAAHGKQISFRAVPHKSKKVYDRNKIKRAFTNSDEGSLFYGSLRCENRLIPRTRQNRG